MLSSQNYPYRDSPEGSASAPCANMRGLCGPVIDLRSRQGCAGLANQFELAVLVHFLPFNLSSSHIISPLKNMSTIIEATPAAAIPIHPIADEYDVVIVGAGPAGLMASTCLTTFGFSVLHIDDRSEPTIAGRADGLQPRTIEVLRNIGGVKLDDNPGFLASGKAPFNGAGLAKRMISQGVRGVPAPRSVYEVAFWDPTETEQLARTSRAPSCPTDIIDVQDPYTLLLHQGMIEHSFLDEVEARRRRLPADKLITAPPGGVSRPYLFETCSHDPSTNTTFPVSATFTHAVTKKTHVVRSKYLLGCDGARSLVRRAMAGGQPGDGERTGAIRMLGDTSDIIWGVMDVVVKTDFPDIMSKCMIHSKDSGSIMVIPREVSVLGTYSNESNLYLFPSQNGLVRLYVQLQAEDGHGTTTHLGRDARQEICIEHAQKIFQPFKLEVGHVDWFSVYQIGQRIASHYMMEDQRIILGGDATHTHSPKAGQGMNISMLDMYSLCWKINLVEKKMADHSVLIPTYETERRGIAEALLKFDSAYSAMFSGRNPDATQLTSDTTKAVNKGVGAVDAQKFIDAFKQNAFFTSGCGAVYGANILNALPESDIAKASKAGVFNPTGTKLICGQRLLPGLVTRAVDANRVRIQQEVKMTGAFRIHVFAGDYQTSKPALAAFEKFITAPTSFHNVHRPAAGVTSSIVDGTGSTGRHIETAKPTIERNPFFTYLTVFSTPHTEWEIESLPYSLRSYRDYVYSDDVPEVRTYGQAAPMHFKYGVDITKGAIIAVRPDGYVGAVVALSEDGFEALNAYFKQFLTGAK
ncbi:phenol 2-monooxygenase (NADPH), partial [Phenoliferia sp. Uapishka_3]